MFRIKCLQYSWMDVEMCSSLTQSGENWDNSIGIKNKWGPQKRSGTAEVFQRKHIDFRFF